MQKLGKMASGAGQFSPPASGNRDILDKIEDLGQVIPCPYCRRPLHLPAGHGSLIGCSSCGNVSAYDNKSRTLAPYKATAQNSSRMVRKIKLPPISWIIGILLTLCVAASLCIYYFFLPPPLPKEDLEPRETLNEIDRHLKSLAQ